MNKNKIGIKVNLVDEKPKIKLVKLWKKVGGTVTDEKYVLLTEEYEFEHDEIKCMAEDWADRIPGGHNRGYEYGWHDIESRREILSYLYGKIKKDKEKVIKARENLKLTEELLVEIGTRKSTWTKNLKE